MTFHLNFKHLAVSAIFALTLTSGIMGALAQEPTRLPPPDASVVVVDSELMPDEETHPPIRLTGDKSRILDMSEDVERVIIGNDAHLNILLDTSRRLIIVPRLAGATHFTLLGANGKVLMQRHVVIASPLEKYVRIRKTCRELDACMPIRMFYCPGLCHEIAVLGADGTAFSGSIPSAAGKGGGDDDSPVALAQDAADDAAGGDE